MKSAAVGWMPFVQRLAGEPLQRSNGRSNACSELDRPVARLLASTACVVVALSLLALECLNMPLGREPEPEPERILIL